MKEIFPETETIWSMKIIGSDIAIKTCTCTGNHKSMLKQYLSYTYLFIIGNKEYL